MMTEVEAVASKTRHAIHDASDTVAETAKAQGSRVEKFVRLGLHALSVLPERTFERVLDRLGLMRRKSGLGAVALFAGGFAAGSVVTAFATPYSGAELRRKVYDLARGGSEAKTVAVELPDNGRVGERVGNSSRPS